MDHKGVSTKGRTTGYAVKKTPRSFMSHPNKKRTASLSVRSGKKEDMRLHV